MPEDTGFYIDDICIPHTWYPISERNNLIAFKFINTIFFAYVPAGNYNATDLGVAIAKSMNDAFALGERFESAYDAGTNKLTIKFNTAIKGTSAFQIYTDVEIKQIAPSLVSRSMNGILKNTVLKSV